MSLWQITRWSTIYTNVMRESAYSEFFSAALLAIIEAEQIILDYFHNQNFTIEIKADDSPVTIADKTVESLIKTRLHKAFPNHGFFGEEEGADSKDVEFVWSIDPIDGTKNFIRGLPFFSTELALLHEGKVVLGISNAPLLKSRLSAVLGQSAFANDKQIHVSKVAKLANGYVSHGGIKHFANNNILDNLVTISKTAHAIRGFGDSWSFQQVAQGKLDAMIEARIRLWDVAAHTIIISEAGGSVTNLDSSPVNFDSTKVLATNGLLHQELLDLLC